MTEREAVDDDSDRGWHRCFIALVPDPATRDALAAVPVGSAARRVAADQLHMTMAFLGSLAPSTGAMLARRLGSVVAPLAPQHAQPCEYWPNAAHPRLMVVPFDAGDGLAELAARVRALVGSLGLPVDDHRPFRPHITLARFARSSRASRSFTRADDAGVEHRSPSPRGALPLDAATLPAVPRFDALTLYSSTLARHGARYRALASVAVPAA